MDEHPVGLVSRDLSGARLLFKGTPWLRRSVLVVGGLATAGIVVAILVEPWPLRATVVLGGLFVLATLGLWALLEWSGVAAEAWATEDALVVRTHGTRWLRIPWSEIGSGTWLPARYRRGDGPAITTRTGGRYDRPSPDYYTMLAAPITSGDWLAGARAMRDEFERRGIPWEYEVDERRVEGHWTTTRWDW